MGLINWKACRAFIIEESKARRGIDCNTVSESWKPRLEAGVREAIRREVLNMSAWRKRLRPVDSLKGGA